MSACWMLMMILGCRLSRATQPETSCPCNYHSQIFNTTISVPCLKPTGEDVAFSLHKDDKKIYEHTCSFRENASTCAIHTDTGMRLQGNNESVSFILSGEMATQHGVYRCDAAITFPPPYSYFKNILGILVPEKDPKCVCNTPKRVEWVWILVAALLGVYSIIITIIAVVNWVKMREIDSQNDYINTKPKPAKDYRRNRHRQHPIRPFQ